MFQELFRIFLEKNCEFKKKVEEASFLLQKCDQSIVHFLSMP